MSLLCVILVGMKHTSFLVMSCIQYTPTHACCGLCDSSLVPYLVCTCDCNLLLVLSMVYGLLMNSTYGCTSHFNTCTHVIFVSSCKLSLPHYVLSSLMQKCIYNQIYMHTIVHNMYVHIVRSYTYTPRNFQKVSMQVIICG